MKTYLPLITLVAGFWFIACAASATKETSPAASNSIALDKPFHPRIAAKDTGIQQQIQKYAAEAKARVGVGAVDLETGEYFSLDGDAHFPMQSVYKLPIALELLTQVSQGKLSLDRQVWIGPGDVRACCTISRRHPDGGVFITAGDDPQTREAIRRTERPSLLKPFDEQRLLDALERATHSH